MNDEYKLMLENCFKSGAERMKRIIRNVKNGVTMEVSVIIPTYNRVKDLDECLNSIIVQTKVPKEILVIDNSADIKTEKLIEERKTEFRERGIILEYIKNVRENSLTIAKNIGINCSTCGIISFLDDDLLLDAKYYEEIIKVYEEMDGSLGVQGLMKKSKEKKIIFIFIDIFNRLFYIYRNEKNECRLLPSLGVSYPSYADEIISCEWLSGASTYKRTILEEFKFDENLKKYSWGEDQDISYRIFKEYPHSLFATPYARYIHKTSQEGRIPKKELIYMEEIYPLYLFYKLLDQNLKNKMTYLWSRLGRIFFNIIFLIFKSKSKLAEIRYRIGAPIYCMKHVNELKKGDLDFFNMELK